jgi:tetratricopeptide (TPR) repeat protein
MAGSLPPAQPTVAAVAVLDAQHMQHESSLPDQLFDGTVSLNTLSIGRTTPSVDGNSGGGGKARPVAGATGDDRSDESAYRQSGAVLPEEQEVSQATPLGAASAEETEDELAIWKRIADEATKMQASVRVEALMDPDILGQLVAPVEARLDTEDVAEYARTEQRYEMAVSEEPGNALLLANFAQFLYLVQRDHDRWVAQPVRQNDIVEIVSIFYTAADLTNACRAEHYFQRAVQAEPADAETLGWYAAFLWKARNDLAAAEETYQEAIAAEPSNGHHAAAYAHFLWNTGGEDTCYPLD